MDLREQRKPGECRRSQIAEYFDGELSADDEREVFEHLQTCVSCQKEFSIIERISGEFDISPLMPVELPADFAKVVAARAESQVGGLRSNREKLVTLAVVASIISLLTLVLGFNFPAIAGIAWLVLGKIAALFGFFFNILENFVYGTAVVARFAAARFETLDGGSRLMIIAMVLVVIFTLFRFARSRHQLRLREVKR